MAKEKYLITGGAGFVGRELISQLLADDNEVFAIGRRNQYDSRVHFIQGDIRNLEDLRVKLKNIDFEYLLHIASLPGDTGDPLEMFQVNGNGCIHMMEIAREHRVKRMVLASSISAYEWYPATPFHAPDYMPVDEDHPCRPEDMYSTTKRIQELLAVTYYHEFNLPIITLRFTAIIGPNGQGGGRGWREIAEQMASGGVVKLPHFSAEERCHYVDVRDVARMVRHAALSVSGDGEIFNCCGPESITGAEFGDIVRRYFPSSTVEFGFPWSMAQGGQIAFSMEKAERIMGYKPIYSVDDSVKYIKEWIDSGGLKADVNRKEHFGEGVQK